MEQATSQYNASKPLSRRQKIAKTALRFASEYTMATIPLHGIKEDGSCTCQKGRGCSAKGKHPIHYKWTDRASHELEATKALFESVFVKQPNIGLVCGAISDVTVIDVDFRSGGAESMKLYQDTFGELPKTTIVETGNGYHLYFRHAPELDEFTKLEELMPEGVKLPGVDIRRTGNFVVTVGSLHANGRTYKFRDSVKLADRVPLPEELIQAAQEAKERRGQGKTSSRPKGKDNDHFVNMLRYTPDGERNNALASLTGKFLHHGLSASIVYEMMRIWNQTSVDPPIDEDEFNNSFKSILLKDMEKRQGQIRSDFKKLD